MGGDAEDAARREQAYQAGLSDTTEAFCVTIDWLNRLAQINIGGAVIPMPWLGAPPWPKDRVRVIYAGQKPVCELIHGAPEGTIVSVASNIATVDGDDGKQYAFPYSTELTLSAGNRVAIDHAHRIVAAKYSAEPPGSTLRLPPAPPGGSGSALFRPIDSGNFSNGSFTTNFVEVSSSRTAAYWYSTQIADTIPDSAVITRAEIQLVELWDQLPSVASQMGTHGQASRGGEPTISGTINVFGSGTVPLESFADLLKTGAALGIGFRKNTGWRRFDSFAGSGGIYMEWH